MRTAYFARMCFMAGAFIGVFVGGSAERFGWPGLVSAAAGLVIYVGGSIVVEILGHRSERKAERAAVVPGRERAMSASEARHERKMARLRRVAEVYNGADEKPAQAVAEALGVPATTARTLVFRAREAGLIGAYEPPPTKWRTEYGWAPDGDASEVRVSLNPDPAVREMWVRRCVREHGGSVFVRDVTEWRQEP